MERTNAAEQRSDDLQLTTSIHYWCDSPTCNSTVLMDASVVAIILRHGDRAPIAERVGVLDTVSAAAAAFWSARLPSRATKAKWARSPVVRDDDVGSSWDSAVSHLGRLTVLGGKECVAVGKVLRARYGSLPIVYARATNISRTQESAQCVVAGHGSVPKTIHVVVDEPMLASHAKRECPKRLMLAAQMMRRGTESGNALYVGYDDLRARVVERFFGGDEGAEVEWCVRCHARARPPRRHAHRS